MELSSMLHLNHSCNFTQYKGNSFPVVYAFLPRLGAYHAVIEAVKSFVSQRVLKIFVVDFEVPVTLRTSQSLES